MIASLVFAQHLASTLVVNGLIIGSHERGRWVQASDVLPTWQNAVFRRVRVGRLSPVVKVEKPVIWELSGAPGVSGSEGVLWSGPDPTFPRPLSVGKMVPKARQSLVRAYLREQGVTGAVSWIRHVIGDLDGDGVSEALIEGRGPTWSAVFYIGAGKSPVVISWARSNDDGLTLHHLEALADFDHDGRFEAVLSGSYLEGHSGTVLSFTKDGWEQVLEKGC